jgi:hypothetical protein
MAEKKVTGPASYFPSIEKKYGEQTGTWITYDAKGKVYKKTLMASR